MKRLNVLQRMAWVIVFSLVTIAILTPALLWAQTPGTWTPAGDLSQRRAGHTATLLANGNILIIGGENQSGPVGQSEMFDPAAATFSSGATLIVPRSDHSATLLPDGRVLVAGGRNQSGLLNSTEIFDPGTNSFSSGPSLNIARAGHSATVLTDGKILFAGGDGGSAEIYDPVAQTITATANMTTPRVLHGAVLLKDGKVLIAGGVVSGNTGLNSAEIFDPQTMTFRATSEPMQGARTLPTFKVLPDGKVQVIGGDGLFSMEVFDVVAENFNGLASLPPTEELLSATLSTQSRAALITTAIAQNPYCVTCATGDFLGLLGRTDHSLTEIPLLNQALVAGGLDSSGQALTSAYMLKSSSASVTTQKVDYPPGGPVAIIGNGFQPGETVSMIIHEMPDAYPDFTLTSVADENGNFTNTDFSPGSSDVGRTFLVTATAQTSGFTAQTTFTDAPAKVGLVTVGSQTGTLTAGTAGSVTYEITVNRGQSGAFNANLCVNSTLPTGVSYSFNPSLLPFPASTDSGTSTLTITTTSATPAGSFPFTVRAYNTEGGTTCTSTGGDWAEKAGTLNIIQPAQDLTVTKTATASFARTYKWLIDKSVDKIQINIAEGGTATFNYSVKVTPDGYTDSGWTVSGKITVANPNSFDVSGVNVTDAINNGGVCSVTGGTNVTILASGNVVLDYSCTYAAAPSPAAGTNTATATWDKTTYGTPNGSASGTAAVDFSTVTPSETNKTITVTDDKTDPANPVTLGTWNSADGEHTFTYALTKSGVAGTCTNYTNTAKITETGQSASKTVTVCVGKDLALSKTAAGTFNRTYLWTISKGVDKTLVNIAEGGSYTFHYTVVAGQTGFTDSGWTLSGKITITNPNDWEDITLTNLTDVVDNGGTCTVATGPYVVPKSGSLDVNYSCSYSSAPSSNSGTNTATATWDKAAAFTPNGSATGSAAFTLSQLGSTNKTVHVTDTGGGALGTVTGTDSAPFATASFTYARTVSGVGGTCTEYTNTATITETGQSASKTVTVCVGKDLTVSKTATPTFTRTFLWDISKSVDKTLVRQNSGSVTFNYTVEVNETGFTDSDWKVTGTITVTNPNNWEDITLTSLSDVVDNSHVCTVDAGPYVVPKSNSLNVNYTCTYTSAPSSGTNTATATWDKAAYFTPDGSATGTASFAFTTPTTTVNKTVNVTDSFAGTLGTVTATDSQPYASATFTYSHTVPVPPAACQSYTNTAKIVETDQSDSQTVTVCKPSLLTDSSLCSLNNNQLKLILTPDQNAQGSWKLNASNPGQFYYNIFYTGAGDEDIKITLPYPWVTQGAVPIHVYSNVGVTTNGTTCLTPIGELSNESDQVTLASYGDGSTPSYDFSKTTTVTIHVPAVSGGFAYINIHLDYGLKGTTGYAKGGSSGNDAVKVNTSTVLIPDLEPYAFSDTTGGAITATSTNSFKKDPGIGGLVLESVSNGNDPVANVMVEIYDSKNKLLATVTTDQDGWYMWQYKYTGKPTTFAVKLPASGLTQSVTLKSNGFLIVNFILP